MKIKDFIEVFSGTIDVVDNYTEELYIAYQESDIQKREQYLYGIYNYGLQKQITLRTMIWI